MGLILYYLDMRKNEKSFDDICVEVDLDIELTESNCKDKALQIPNLHAKYLRKYAIAKSKRQSLKNKLSTMKSDLLVKYKYKDKFTWDKKDQLDIRIQGDIEYQDIESQLENVDNLIEFYKGVVNTINNMNFSITNYHKLVSWQEGN